MPVQPQEKNIDDLRSQQQGNDESRMQRTQSSELRIAQTEARRKQKISSVLGDIPQGVANSEQSTDEQSGNPDQNAQQTGSQNQQPDKEEKTKKLGLFQFRKQQKVMEEIRKLQKEMDKLKKLTDKYKSTNFFFLALLAGFIEMADLLINLFWATIILIPVAIILWVMKELACLFIFIKIHKIKNEQKTKDAWWWSLIASVVGLIPGINILPETLVRVRQARNSAKAAFEKHKDEIKKIEEKMSKLIKQLG